MKITLSREEVAEAVCSWYEDELGLTGAEITLEVVHKNGSITLNVEKRPESGVIYNEES